MLDEDAVEQPYHSARHSWKRFAIVRLETSEVNYVEETEGSRIRQLR